MESRAKRFRIKLLLSMAAIIMLTISYITFINYRLTDSYLQANTEAVLEIYTERIMAEIEHLDIILNITKEMMNNEHISIARAIDHILEDAPPSELTPEKLQQLAEPLDIIELNIVNSRGVLTHSNMPELIGFNYNDYDSTRIYMTLVTDTLSEIGEDPRQSVLDDNTLGDINHYAGVARRGGGFIQLGFNADVIALLHDEINIDREVKSNRIGDTGYGMVVTQGVITAHIDDSMIGMDVTDKDWYKAVNAGYGYTWVDIDGTRFFAGYKNDYEYTVIGLMPEAEYYGASRDLLSRAVVLLIIAVAVIIPLIYMFTGTLLRPVKKNDGHENDGHEENTPPESITAPS